MQESSTLILVALGGGALLFTFLAVLMGPRGN